MTTKDLCERARRLIERGEFEKALPDLQQALKQRPDDAQLWLFTGVELGLASRHEDALTCFERCTALHPRVFTGWYHKGVAVTALDRGAEAIACYRRARRLNPTDASSAFNLGMELCKTGAFAEAVEHLWDAKTLGHERAPQVLTACRQMLE